MKQLILTDLSNIKCEIMAKIRKILLKMDLDLLS